MPLAHIQVEQDIADRGYVQADGNQYELTPSGAMHLQAVSAD